MKSLAPKVTFNKYLPLMALGTDLRKTPPCVSGPRIPLRLAKTRFFLIPPAFCKSLFSTTADLSLHLPFTSSELCRSSMEGLSGVEGGITMSEGRKETLPSTCAGRSGGFRHMEWICHQWSGGKLCSRSSASVSLLLFLPRELELAIFNS